MSGANELWYVQLSDGDVHRVTLDQLDEGFQAGHIDAGTMVLASGSTRWTKLGELAGMDEIAPPHAPPVLAPPPLSALFTAPPPLIESHRPVSVDLVDLDVVPGLPRRSRKTWIATLLGVAMLGGVAGVGVERPSLLQASFVSARTSAVAAKSWIATEVPGRLLGSKPPPPAVTATPPPAETAPTPTTPQTPSAPSAEPAASAPAALASDRAGSDPAKQPPRGAGTKGHIKKGHPKPQGSPDVPQRPPSAGGFTSSGNKFDPLSSSIP